MTSKLVRNVRLGALGALVIAAISTEQAAGQCMWWDVSVGPLDTHEARALRVLDIGSGPQLFRGYGSYFGEVGLWTGTSWAPLGNGYFNDRPYCLASYDSGTGPHLYAGGGFTFVLGAYAVDRLAMLLPAGWANIGIPASAGGAVLALQVFDGGQGPMLYVGGSFQTHSSLASPSLVTWNGTTWGGVGGGLTGAPPYSPIVNAMCIFDDGTGSALYVGGTFLAAGGVTARQIAKWNGTTWTPLGSGLSQAGPQAPGGVAAMTVFDDGAGPALYVGGVFDHAGGVLANGIAKWDGANWSELPGLHGLPESAPIGVWSLTTHDNGNGTALYAGLASAAAIGQNQVRGVARWDGQSWSSLGGGFGGLGYALASFDDGQGSGPALWVGGTNNSVPVGGNLRPADIARWYGGCTHGIDPMCIGDGTFAACPCANYGSSLHGCGNSANSSGALLSATGTTTPDTLVLTSAAQLVGSSSIFLQSGVLLPVQQGFGDGILCLGGTLLRLFVKTPAGGTAQAPEPGDPSITQMSAALGDPIAPGSVRYYQVWYRDGSPTFCGTARYNISNGLRVVW